MPSKRRRIIQSNRRRKKHQEESQSQFIYLQTSYEKNLEKIESDIRTIPDQTFGKVYSTQIISYPQIIEQNSSLNTSTIMNSDIILSSRNKTRKIKKKRK